MALAGILEDPSDTRILLQKHHLKWEKKEKKKKEKKKKKISQPDDIEKRKKEKQSMKGEGWEREAAPLKSSSM